MTHARLGTYLFLFSESIFFAFLLIAYVNFHLGPANGDMSRDLDVARTSINTAFLLSSSFTAWRAHSAYLESKTRRFQIWTAATIALGLVFIRGQASEYFRLFEKEVTVSRDPLSSSFFTVTGFHGLHVCAGVLLFALLLGWSLILERSHPERRDGEFTNRRVPAGSVTAISLYWHFVDVVWIAVFAIVYLWGTR